MFPLEYKNTMQERMALCDPLPIDVSVNDLYHIAPSVLCACSYYARLATGRLVGSLQLTACLQVVG